MMDRPGLARRRHMPVQQPRMYARELLIKQRPPLLLIVHPSSRASIRQTDSRQRRDQRAALLDAGGASALTS
jgi:hypothetical protein